MDQMYISAIAIFGCNFAPRNWAFCNGQLIPIAQNTALFSLLGTTYGGNGTTNFALPDLQGRVPIGLGQGLGLSQYILGETGGQTNITLLNTEIPQHNHSLLVNNVAGNAAAPTAGLSIANASDINGDGATLFNNIAPNTVLSGPTVGFSGGGQPHNNQQPYLGSNYCICLFGVFPARN